MLRNITVLLVEYGISINKSMVCPNYTDAVVREKEIKYRMKSGRFMRVVNGTIFLKY